MPGAVVDDALARTVTALEEVFFRGRVLSWLARRAPIGVAVVLSTVAFTMVHGIGPHSYNSVQLPSVAADGLVFASLYVASGSLQPGMVAHMAVNAVALLVSVSGLDVLFFAVLLVAIGAPGAVCVARGYGRRPLLDALSR
jgi:membrane protease YdiL (CAAX protease family)